MVIVDDLVQSGGTLINCAKVGKVSLRMMFGNTSIEQLFIETTADEGL